MIDCHMAFTDSRFSLESLGYIGHSLGTDQMFALQSLIPESGRLFEPFIALAPVAYLGGIWSIARFGVPLEPLLRLAITIVPFDFCLIIYKHLQGISRSNRCSGTNYAVDSRCNLRQRIS